MNPEVIAVVAALVGFIAGAFLASTMHAEARAVESRLAIALRAVRNEAEQRRSELEAKRAQLEKDAKDSFEVFSNDVEAIVKRIEALEQHADQKICAVINPAGKS